MSDLHFAEMAARQEALLRENEELDVDTLVDDADRLLQQPAEVASPTRLSSGVREAARAARASRERRSGENPFGGGGGDGGDGGSGLSSPASSPARGPRGSVKESVRRDFQVGNSGAATVAPLFVGLDDESARGRGSSAQGSARSHHPSDGGGTVGPGRSSSSSGRQPTSRGRRQVQPPPPSTESDWVGGGNGADESEAGVEPRTISVVVAAATHASTTLGSPGTAADSGLGNDAADRYQKARVRVLQQQVGHLSGEVAQLQAALGESQQRAKHEQEEARRRERQVAGLQEKLDKATAAKDKAEAMVSANCSHCSDVFTHACVHI